LLVNTFSKFRLKTMESQNKSLKDRMSKSQTHFFNNIRTVESEGNEKHEKLVVKRFEKFERLVMILKN